MSKLTNNWSGYNNRQIVHFLGNKSFSNNFGECVAVGQIREQAVTIQNKYLNNQTTRLVITQSQFYLKLPHQSKEVTPGC